MLSSWWQSQSKGAKVFTRVAVLTGLIIVGIHYNQHQERQVGAVLKSSGWVVYQLTFELGKGFAKLTMIVQRQSVAVRQLAVRQA